MITKYFIKHALFGEKEVSKEEFIKAERAAGFRSKFGINNLATGGFTSGDVTGRVEYLEEEE